MLPQVVRWYREVGRTTAYPDPSARTAAVLTDLRQRPGLWAEISRHSSKGAAQVSAHRWRKRWRGQKDGHLFRARVSPHRLEGEEPYALLLAYKPTVEEVTDAPALSTE